MLALYARLLLLYPPSFRTRFGAEMLQLVRDEGVHGQRVSWLRTFADLFASALVQRSKEKGMRTKIAVALFVVAVVGGGTTVLIGAPPWRPTGFMLMGIMLAFVGLVFGVASLLGRRGDMGAEHDYAARKFRWWWVPAGLIGAFQALAMIGQLIDEPKKENVFALVLIGVFSALVFGGMAVHNRRAGNWMIAAGVLPMLPMIWWYAPPVVSLLVIVMALADNVRMARPHAAV
jgi:hypothetical protein